MKTRTLMLSAASAAALAAVVVGGFLAFYRPPDEGESIAPPPDVAPPPEPAEKGPLRTVDEFRPIRRMGPLPPLTKFPVVSAAEAGKVDAGESVLGVEVGGEARAYPIQMLTYVDNEIVNDTLGGRPIAVTWRDRCQNAAVFSRLVGGRALTFRISGSVWLDNMVMEDVETRSLWSNLLGRAMKGLEQGTELETIPCVVTDWKTWRSEHPETTLAVLGRVPEEVSQVGRYAAKADEGGFVLGYASKGSAGRSWPLDLLKDHPVVNDRLDDVPLLLTFDPSTSTACLFSRLLDRRELTFRAGPSPSTLTDDPTGSTWDAITGRATDGPLKGKSLEPLPGVVVLRRVWKDFHPKGEVWKP